MDELCNRIEAILFASGKGVSEEELITYCGVEPKAIKKAIAQLQKNLEEREGSLIISLHNNRWKMTVRGKYLKDVESIVSETELPTPVLKTLAVVAYKSPVLQADIVNMRGQSAYEHIKELAKQKFITKEERGRSYLLKITDKFYNYFDVEGDEEIQEVFAKLREKQKTLGDLQVVDAEPEKTKEEKEATAQEQLGELEIIPIIPRTREKTEDDDREEKDFLKRMDEGIDALSKRVEEHQLPTRQRPEQEEKETTPQDDDNENVDESEEEITETKQEETTTATKKPDTEDEDPLKTLEKLADKNEQEEDEDYL